MLKQSQLDLCGRVDFTREVPLMDPRDEQEVRIAEAAERRNLALAEAARHERRRDRELGEAVAARAPGGRWKRMNLQREKGQKS